MTDIFAAYSNVHHEGNSDMVYVGLDRDKALKALSKENRADEFHIEIWRNDLLVSIETFVQVTTMEKTDDQY